jgi:hypothetical protein
MGVGQFQDEARLSHSRLPDNGGDLAAALPGLLKSTVKVLEFSIAAHKPREPARSGRLQPRAHGTDPREFVDVDRRREALHGHGPQWSHLYEAFGERQGVECQEDRPRIGELFHPRREMRGLTDGRIVHVKVGPDRPNDHLSRVEAHADANRDAVLPAHALRVLLYRLLHPERRVAGADGVILMGNGCAEERHDAVAHNLVDGSLVAVDRLHHAFQHGIQQLACLLRIAIGEQLHRPLQVGEQDGHLFSLTLDSGPRR